MPPSVPAGLPSDLIERRPDIRAAENSLIAANARIEVAKKAFFPRISFSAFLGYESGQITSLFSASRSVWSLVPQVTQPIFTGGRLKSNVRFSQAEREFLLIDYQKTIQDAFREVSDSLIAYQKVREVRTQRGFLVGHCAIAQDFLIYVTRAASRLCSRHWTLTGNYLRLSAVSL